MEEIRNKVNELKMALLKLNGTSILLAKDLREAFKHTPEEIREIVDKMSPVPINETKRLEIGLLKDMLESGRFSAEEIVSLAFNMGLVMGRYEAELFITGKEIV